MKRVASLYLPHWSIDRIVRRERRAQPQQPDAATIDLAPLVERASAEQVLQCDAPKNTGWRPGARWARADVITPQAAKVDHDVALRDTRANVARQIAALPTHQRPPMRELGRRSEAADMPFKLLPGDDGGKATGWSEPGNDRAPAAIARWNAVPAIRYPGDGPHPDKHARRGSNDPHSPPPGVAAFFDTGRTTASTVARVCPERSPSRTTASADALPPLVTAQKIGSRIEIAAVSPAATALGIECGMALTQARAAIPALDVRDADPAGDAIDLEALATMLARRWCPVVAIDGTDGLLLDLTGVAHLHGGEAAMAQRLVRLLTRVGVTARIAIADTAGAAWAMARFADPPAANPPSASPAAATPLAIVAPAAQRHAIVPLPIAALRLDAAACDRLAALGVDTVGDLLGMPRAPLVRRFGATVARRLDQATGTAPEPFDPIVVPLPIMVERRFAEPIATAEAIHHWLAGLVGELGDALAAAGRGARALLFVIARVDSSAQVIRIGLARATRDPAHLLRLIVRRIEAVDPGYGIDALSLHVRRDEPLGAQALGPALAEQPAPDLAPLVDALANRIGPQRLWRRRVVESDVPERSVADAPPLDPPDRAATILRIDDVRRLDARAPDHPWHPRWPRPARLLRRPEPIDHVIAELPDQPPKRFTWRGRRHVVVRADGPERIVGEWWRRSAERHAIRDYFQVEDEAGARFWLFRRGDGVRAETGDLSWYLHGAFG